MRRITLLTISPDASVVRRLFWQLKNYLKQRFFYYGGPSAVLESLIRGFETLKVDYQLNPQAKKISDIVCVLSGVDVLKWAIEAKRKGRIKKIIAGPNIVVTPLDTKGILLNDIIDLIVVPSQWVKDFYSSFSDSFEKRIRIWAAGVENPKDFKEKERKGCLIYKKSVDEALFNFIIEYLKSQKIDYQIIKWGKYKKEKYFEILNRVKFMIYLSESESQGLALLEAWIRNVLTLVWNQGYFEYKKMAKRVFGNISAPYLTEECGMFFRGKEDFVDKFRDFIKNLSNFKPREYSLRNFTDEIAVSNYLKIINELDENYGK